jgi:hypothetical protein
MRSYRFALTASALYAEMQLGGHDPAVRQRTNRGLAWLGSARSAPSVETMPFHAHFMTLLCQLWPRGLSHFERSTDGLNFALCAFVSLRRAFGSDLCAALQALVGDMMRAESLAANEYIVRAYRCNSPRSKQNPTPPQTTPHHPRPPPDHPQPCNRPFGIRWCAEVNRHATRTRSRYSEYDCLACPAGACELCALRVYRASRPRRGVWHGSNPRSSYPTLPWYTQKGRV